MQHLNLVKMFLVLIVSLISSNINTSFANDAPMNLEGGGARALTGPLTVAMDSETVRIILGKDSYIVDATFNFSNGGETVKLDVGFPKNGAGLLDKRFAHTSDFLKFETWVDGKRVNVVEEPNFASIEGNYTLPELIKRIKQADNLADLRAKDYRWIVKKRILFPSDKITTTRVRYVAPYLDSGAECKGGLEYIYGTGSYWKGNIKESKFTVDASGIPKEDRPKHIGFINERDKSKVECSTISDGVIECLLKNYKPATPDASVVVEVGCIDYERH